MKKVVVKKAATWAMSALVLLSLAVPQAALARPYYGQSYYNNYNGSNNSYNPPGTAVGRYFNQHPIVKKAAIGAGAGALLGGLLGGNNRGGGLVKGAVIGGLAGTAWGYAQNKGYLGGNPQVSNNNGYYYDSQTGRYYPY